MGAGAPKLELNEDEALNLADETEAQAKLDVIVRRIQTLLKRQTEKQHLN